MFEVTRVQRGRGSDELELTATEEISGNKFFLVQRGLGLFECPYRFEKGSTLRLDFPSSKKLKIGDVVDIATVLEHPSVQETITRPWRRHF